MKSTVWHKALQAYVLPDLPGKWRISGGLLYQEPADWLLRGLLLQTSSFSSDFWVERFVRLLACPSQGLHVASPLGHGTGRSLWSASESVSDAEPVFREIGHLIQTEALPFFAEKGTLDGFEAEIWRHVSDNPLNTRYYEQLTYSALVRGDLAAARIAAGKVNEAVVVNAPPWVAEIRDGIRQLMGTAEQSLPEAMEILRAQATASRARYKIA